MKKVIFLLLLLFIPTIVANAKCLYSEIADMKKLASNVNYSYEYTISGNDAIFDITLTNLVNDIYFVDANKNLKYYGKKGEFVLKNYKSGETIIYNFYSNNPECLGTPLYSIRIVLPKYNQYYNNEICEGAREYSLCQKWSSHNLDFLTFSDKVNQYKNNKNNNKNNNNSKDKDNNSLFHYIIIFLVDYYYVILILVGMTVTVIVYFRNKRNSIYS